MGEPSRQGRLRAGARSWTWGPWTPKSPPHWNGSRADGGIGPRLSLLLLGFLATEVVPLANRAAELGFDPNASVCRHQRHLRLYADTLECPDLRR